VLWVTTDQFLNSTLEKSQNIILANLTLLVFLPTRLLALVMVQLVNQLQFSGVQRFTLLDYPEKIACILFLPGCNFRCGYCHNPEFVLPETLCKIRDSFVQENIVMSFLKERVGKLEGVVVSGGEPTIHARLPEFFARVKELGFATKLDTNGSHPEMVKTLLEQGLLSYVAMDLKTSFDHRYTDLAGARANGSKVKETLEILKQSKVPFEIRSTLLPAYHSEEVLKAMGEATEGIEKVYLQAFRSQKTLDPKLATTATFSPSELELIADKYFRSYAKEVFIRF